MNNKIKPGEILQVPAGTTINPYEEWSSALESIAKVAMKYGYRNKDLVLEVESSLFRSIVDAYNGVKVYRTGSGTFDPLFFYVLTSYGAIEVRERDRQERMRYT